MPQTKPKGAVKQRRLRLELIMIVRTTMTTSRERAMMSTHHSIARIPRASPLEHQLPPKPTVSTISSTAMTVILMNRLRSSRRVCQFSRMLRQPFPVVDSTAYWAQSLKPQQVQPWNRVATFQQCLTSRSENYSDSLTILRMLRQSRIAPNQLETCDPPKSLPCSKMNSRMSVNGLRCRHNHLLTTLPHRHLCDCTRQ